MTEVITAVAGLWKLALVVGFVVVILIFRRPIHGAIERLFRVSVKRGQTEFTIEGTAPASPREQLPESGRPEPISLDEPKELPPPTQNTPPIARLWDALSAHRFDDAEAALQELQKDTASATDRIKNEVMYLAIGFAEGKPGAGPDHVEKVAEAQPDLRAFALGWLGWAYVRHGAIEQARNAFVRAVAASASDDERAKHTVSLAKTFIRVGAHDDAERLLTERLASRASDAAQASIYRTLADVYRDQGNKLMLAIVLEKAVELLPADRDVRFAAAYAECDTDLKFLGAANYDTLIDRDPASAGVAMNNLAIQASDFGLPIRAVALYSSAAERDETLAVANLAYRLLSQGFVREARTMLKEASAKADAHPNVSEAIAEATKREAAEEEAWSQVLQRGTRERLFAHQFADARFRPQYDHSQFGGKWRTPEGDTIEFELASDRIAATWGTTPAPSSLAGLVPARSTRFSGHTKGASAVGRLTKKQPTFLNAEGYWNNGETALACVSSDGLRLEILVLDRNTPHVLTFARV